MEGIVLRNRNPESIIARHRIATEAHLGYDHILSRIQFLVDLLSVQSGQTPSAIGLCTPGTMDPFTATLKNSNTLCLNARPLDKDLEALLGVPVQLANDANCFALAEYHFGIVAQGYPDAKVVFGVIMGTGVGGGLVTHGHLISGHHGIGGEWGHLTLDPSGPGCYCGRRGCVETLISGPALEQHYFEKTGVRKPLQHILSGQNDTEAMEVKERLLHYFGLGLAQIINIVDPDVIVLGGGLSQIDFLYTEGRDRVEQHIFNPVLQTPIVRPALGDSAGVYGAALLL